MGLGLGAGPGRRLKGRGSRLYVVRVDSSNTTTTGGATTTGPDATHPPTICQNSGGGGGARGGRTRTRPGRPPRDHHTPDGTATSAYSAILHPKWTAPPATLSVVTNVIMSPLPPPPLPPPTTHHIVTHSAGVTHGLLSIPFFYRRSSAKGILYVWHRRCCTGSRHQGHDKRAGISLLLSTLSKMAV